MKVEPEATSATAKEKFDSEGSRKNLPKMLGQCKLLQCAPQSSNMLSEQRKASKTILEQRQKRQL